MLEEAEQFFVDQLLNTDEGKKVLKYLKKRGVEEETVKTEHLGFAPDSRESLYSYLLKKDFTRDEILASGLAIARDTEKSQCLDRFRMRLMFPIENLNGNVCAFGGRAVREGDEPKYLNSPETPIYYKSSLMYGLAKARSAIRENKSAIIVEGYMDALALCQAGYKNVAACGGTSLTDDQLAVLKRFTKNVIFAFDRDDAGKLATERAIELAMPQDFFVRVAVWQSNDKDPDECIQKNPKAFASAVEIAPPAADYLLTYFKEKFDAKNSQGKKQIIEAFLPFWNKLISPVELDQWLRSCSENIGISLQSIYDELKRFQGKQKFLKGPSQPQPETAKITKGFDIYEYLLGLLLTYPEAYSIANQFLTPEDFEKNDLQNIYRSLTSEYNQTLTEEEKQKMNVLSIYIEALHADAPWEVIECEVIEMTLGIIKKKFDREKRTLVSRMKDEKELEKKELLESYQKLLGREEELVSKILCLKN
ncbi:toprim domain-containing protein [Candidatus Peregrinibacteria bacterium]|nr:toprim domain-containing protein [Candidatus Peregrinibacteria bacterium]